MLTLLTTTLSAQVPYDGLTIFDASSSTNDTCILAAGQTANYLTYQVFLLASPTAPLTLEELLNGSEEGFRPLSDYRSLMPPLVEDTTMYLAPEGPNNWLRVSLKNETQADSFLLFPFSLGTVPNLATAYIVDSEEVVSSFQFGRFRELSEVKRQGVPPSAWPLRRLAVPLFLPHGETRTVYVQYDHDSRFGSQLFSKPAVISNDQVAYFFAPLADHYRKRAFYQGLLWIFIGLSFLNLFLRRDVTYLYYGLYVLGLSAVMSFDIQENSLQIFLLPEAPIMSLRLYHLGAGGMTVFYLLFLRQFLRNNKALPRWNRWVIILTWTSAAATVLFQVLAIFPQYHIGYRINHAYVFSIFFFILTGLGFVVYLVRWRSPQVFFILTGTAFLLIASLLFVLGILGYPISRLGIEPISLMRIGTIAELMVFSVGLAYRDRMIELDKVRMEEVDRMKARFFANISHEFRTPLTLIKTPLEDMLKNGGGGERQAALSGIHRNAERLLELVDQLLELARLEANQGRINKRPADIFNLIRVLGNSFGSLAERRGLQLHIDVADEAKWVLVDLDKFEKIVVNLLSNAIKFARPDSWVKVLATYQDSLLTIRIGNAGETFTPDEINRWFNRFYQHGNTRNQGSGIGLALTQELVQLFEGSIRAEAGEDNSIWFTVSLPITETAAEEPIIELKNNALPQKKNQSYTVIPTIPSADAPHLLLIEDHPELLNYLCNQLGDTYSIITAVNGQEGLDLAIEHLPDLVISDLMMPIMDGLTFCHKLKRDYRTDHIPVILLTAKADLDSRLEGLQQGADDYLAKPFNHQELRLRIHNLLEQRKRLRTRYEHGVRLGTTLVKVEGAEEKFLRMAIKQVEQQLDNPDFSAEDFAANMQLSRTQLHRKLKSVTGMSSTEFTRDLRLQRAGELLKAGSENVAQIAYSVGFNNLSYFAKCFRKKYGCAPSSFKNN